MGELMRDTLRYWAAWAWPRRRRRPAVQPRRRLWFRLPRCNRCGRPSAYALCDPCWFAVGDASLYDDGLYEGDDGPYEGYGDSD